MLDLGILFVAASFKVVEFQYHVGRHQPLCREENWRGMRCCHHQEKPSTYVSRHQVSDP
jgi:hypothetical protein